MVSATPEPLPKAADTTSAPAGTAKAERPIPLARPELLAPAGDWECARAAVENGADAIYFGLDRFNARMRAHNFTEADLPELMRFLHQRGVKGYVTFNTLVFANELADAEQYLRTIITAGVDAAIVQDPGICRLIRRLSPDFPIHASTQMTITSAAGVQFARDLGCSLVVLARECSLTEIEKIQATLSQSAAVESHAGIPSFPLEVFVHGALCVAYSGQCLTSESLGGRSANRGECAQACRMPYQLISDGQEVPLQDKRYLLSPQDLAGLEVLPDLMRVGVASLKIEGRLKSPEYVASITRVYRAALDRLAEAPPSQTSSPTTETLGRDLLQQSAYELEMAFSRGLSTGWFRGIDNQKLVHARFGKKRGVHLGQVTQVGRDSVQLRLLAPLKPGDGIVFDSGHPDQKEEGGRIFQIAAKGTDAVLFFQSGAVDFTRVHPGDHVWKTSDPHLDRELRQTFSAGTPQFARPIRLEMHGHAGVPLTLIARDELGHIVQKTSKIPLAIAENQPLTPERLRQQLGRLGGTPFHLAELTSHLPGNVILPVSELNRLRRDVVAELEAFRAQPKRWTLFPPGHSSISASQVDTVSLADAHSRPGAGQAELIVLVRSVAQLDVALRCRVSTIYCEFEDPKKYREAVARVRQWNHELLQGTDPAHPSIPAQVFVAPPRIFKAGEEWILKLVQSAGADGYLVRNYDHLDFFKGSRCVGDFSFNVANSLTAEYFFTRFQLERLTASYDLNAAQLEALLHSSNPDWFEITIHQHMPMFHMEHCVFCAFLSSGTDYRNCGRPCDKHDVKLRDRAGAEHPLKADAGCRNTVFNAIAQTGAESTQKLIALGARKFRVEFLNESPSQIEQTISEYRKLLRGEISGANLWKHLRLLNQLGVTRGK